jgi:PQQ-dependent dehydrogenase (methanol/ethanol family)
VGNLISARLSRVKRGAGVFAGLIIALGAVSSIAMTAHAGEVANVDDARIIGNGKSGKEWLSNGLDYSATRFSPLDQITTGNVGKLGLAWSYPLNSVRGVEATPIVVDGTMYVTAPWGIVHAVNAKTGEKLWTYDPQAPRDEGYKLCCDIVNRGVAVYKGKVYVGSPDSRLFALDAASGKLLWSVDTSPDRARPYTLTGAPIVIKGKVFVGGGGGEYGVRGVVSAFDAESGKLAWRWYSVPGDPSKPPENEAMAKAAQTWDDKFKYWENGGGGPVWNTFSADPELNLVYFGTGNAGPWASSIRNPSGKDKDNLYTASIVALDIDTGKYAWHYQATPADSWDYDADQDLILTDLTIDGQKRPVLLHADKNGFFFVLDRKTGQFLSAKNFVDVNWASGYTPEGRPIEIAGARGLDKQVEQVPGPIGAHNWHSMSFSPKTGLAYIPAQFVPYVLVDDKTWTGQGSNVPGQVMSGIGWNLGETLVGIPPKNKPFGRLIAWDPVQQKAAWTAEYVSPWNGGTLATAGGLVFHGTADGRIVAYDAANGTKLWDAALGNGVVAAPMTYEIDGKQYVSIAVGWGGVFGESQRATDHESAGIVYTFAIGGDAKYPEVARYKLGPLIQGVKYDPKDVPAGVALYFSNCLFCHGVPGVDKGGNIPNLGYVDADAIENLQNAVVGKQFADRGMPDFDGKLKPEDLEKIKAFIQGTADAIRPK